MRRAALDVLGCPNCFGPLFLSGQDETIENGTLICHRDDLRFQIESGIPDLIVPERLGTAEDFARSYVQAWGLRGPGAFDFERLTDLPFVPFLSKRGRSWYMKARSLMALLGFLEGKSIRRILDLGCGVGWLSYRLAARGFEAYGLDVVRHGPVGLDASRGYRSLAPHFEPVRGEMERPPFQDRRFDLVVASASVHFGQDVPEIFAQVFRMLAPGGVFVMMNSPVHADPDSAGQAQTAARSNLCRLGASRNAASRYRHLVRSDIRTALEGVFHSFNEFEWDPGLRFRIARKLKSLALRTEIAKFPIFWAAKPFE
jgi:SAM-dependent methyltransferase